MELDIWRKMRNLFANSNTGFHVRMRRIEHNRACTELRKCTLLSPGKSQDSIARVKG
jgi:hypothetical protein